jgi:hypothetical protein
MHEDIAALLAVHSSHGTLYLNDVGSVQDVVLDDFADPEAQTICQIRRFDLAEYVSTYGESAREFDILDLGYWWIQRDEENIPIQKYEPPAYDWREMIRQMQKETASE